MGAAESAQRDGKSDEDAIVQEHNEELNAEEGDQNLQVKVNRGNRLRHFSCHRSIQRHLSQSLHLP